MLIRTILLFQFAIFIACQTCAEYLQGLGTTYIINKTKAQQQVVGYVLLSGKSIDDLGFPDSCLNYSNANYITTELIHILPTYNLTVYYGLCINSACTADQLNTLKPTIIGFINNFTSVKIPPDSYANFVQPKLDIEVTPLAIVMLCIFGLLTLIGGIFSLSRWYKQCFQHTEEDEVRERRYTFEDEEKFSGDQSAIPVVQRLSLEYKVQSYLCGRPDKKDKIISFSVFKVFCLPMIIFGQEFYYRNFGAYNFYAFGEQIYDTFYSKVAMFSVYLPDTLFFISGYLLARKCLVIQTFEGKHFAQFLGRKLYRLYPIYAAVLLIFCTITPSTHAGPVWYVFQDQAAICKDAWWRSLLLIGNWWQRQCFAGGWFVQVEFQLCLICLLFFVFYSRWKKITMISYVVLLVGMLVVNFVLAPNMPSSVENVLEQKFFNRATSTYMYLLFYLLGIGVAILRKNAQLTQKITEAFEKSIKPEIVLTILGISLSVLILMRPSIWASVSGVEFALCRIGVFISFFFFFIGGIWKPEDHQNNSRIHQVAHYSYPMMLMSTVITLASVWCMSSFSFVSGLNQVNLLVTELFLSVIVGTYVGMLVEFRFGK